METEKTPNDTSGAQPPPEAGGTKITKPHKVAAGLSAIVSSAKFTLREMGVFRGLGRLALGKQERRLRLPELRMAESRTITGTCSSSAKAA